MCGVTRPGSGAVSGPARACVLPSQKNMHAACRGPCSLQLAAHTLGRCHGHVLAAVCLMQGLFGHAGRKSRWKQEIKRKKMIVCCWLDRAHVMCWWAILWLRDRRCPCALACAQRSSLDPNPPPCACVMPLQLGKYFDLEGRNTTLMSELRAGFVAFLTSAWHGMGMGGGVQRQSMRAPALKRTAPAAAV